MQARRATPFRQAFRTVVLSLDTCAFCRHPIPHPCCPARDRPGPGGLPSVADGGGGGHALPAATGSSLAVLAPGSSSPPDALLTRSYQSTVPTTTAVGLQRRHATQCGPRRTFVPHVQHRCRRSLMLPHVQHGVPRCTRSKKKMPRPWACWAGRSAGTPSTHGAAAGVVRSIANRDTARWSHAHHRTPPVVARHFSISSMKSCAWAHVTRPPAGVAHRSVCTRRSLPT